MPGVDTHILRAHLGSLDTILGKSRDTAIAFQVFLNREGAVFCVSSRLRVVVNVNQPNQLGFFHSTLHLEKALVT